ncbi:MAG: 1-acyl-sn-glycerol-3-phosphate acyltransferase [Spirochaetales bacterium]|nr:1-acyl-sn-glycerol-3-phosphate acyltransferase [Spirochaetales bacterium]
MFVIIRLLIVFILMVVSMVTAVLPALILRLFGLKKASDNLVHFQIAAIANFGFWLAGVRTHVSGDVDEVRRRAKEGEGFCFVANHTSLLDVLLILGKLRVNMGFVAKIELLFIPALNVLIAMIHSVFINRRQLKKSVSAIRKATKRISKGCSMGIFPEGTRSKTGEIGVFKHGSFRMATESGAYVVPLTVKGLRQSFEDRKHIFQIRDAYLDVGTPVKAPDPNDRAATSAFASQIENYIRETYKKLGN